MFDRWSELGLKHYQELGLDARALSLKTREDASRPEVVAGLEEASMFFFSGGNPLYLARALDGTPALDTITRAIGNGAVFAGCSAGAMVAGARVAGGFGPAFRHVGLGLLPNVRFGVHWNRMPGFVPGLKEFMISGGGRGDHFIGIDESTAIVGDGSRWRVFGLGGVDVRGASKRSRYRAGDEFELT